MKMKLLALAFAGVLGVSACETTGGGYGGGGYGGSGYGSSSSGGTHLSRCMRQALIGAGIGAVAGAVVGDEDNRGENAVLGAAVGGAGTYGVCRWLSHREQQRVEAGYYQALSSNRSYSDSWQSDQGAPRSLVVAQPTAAAGRPDCRTVNATVQDPQYGRQSLPAETFCRNASGQWVPA